MARTTTVRLGGTQGPVAHTRGIYSSAAVTDGGVIGSSSATIANEFRLRDGVGLGASASPATITTYSKPTGDIADMPAERWSVTVNGSPTWAHYTPRGEVATVSSDATGTVEVSLTVLANHPGHNSVTSADVHTQEEGVWPPVSPTATIDGNTVSFTLPSGFLGHVAVVLNNRYEPTSGTFDHYPYHFMLGVLPEETWTPAPGEVTHYFGPGVHTGSTITLSSGQSVYIHGGALVRRAIITAWTPPSRLSNIRVGGRGVIDHHNNYNVAALSPGEPRTGLNGLDFVQVDNLTVEGVTSITKGSWNFTPYLCDGVTAEWLRIISCEIQNLSDYTAQGTPDGVDPVGTSNMTLTNSLISASDDSSAIKADKYSKVGDVRDLLLQDLLLMQGGKSNALDIGYELGTRTIERITYRRINIPMCYRDAGAFRTAGIAIHVPTKAIVQDVLYEDVWLQRVDKKDFVHWCATFYYSAGLGSVAGAENRGTIRRITYRRVDWPDYPPAVDVNNNYSNTLGEWFFGRQTGDGPMPSEITIEDCTFLGAPLTSAAADALGWRWVDTDVSGGITWL